MNEHANQAPGGHAPAQLVAVRTRVIDSHVLLTNPWGQWTFVTPEELTILRENRLVAGTELESRLHQAGFIADQDTVKLASEKMRQRKSFCQSGPNLHVVIPTLRCNQTCVYCHASRVAIDDSSTDMSPGTADRVVDFIFRTTSGQIIIEFQGGEPLANFDIVQRVVRRASEANQAANKHLEFSLVSNLSLLDEQKLGFLLENRVQICTSIDGPAALHDRQRKLPGASAHAIAANWIARINSEYARAGLDPVLYHVEALATITGESLKYPREIVDSYLQLGCRAMFLRPLDPFGFASRTTGAGSYDRQAYLAFYREAVDYMLELGRDGTQMIERYAAIFLTKILSGVDPNYLDIRSPCGAGIGQLAYNYDGRIFTCDEGRMLDRMGDSIFAIGSVQTDRYRKVLLNDTVRAMALASNLDGQPGCAGCTYQPYCGTCPVHNYATQGSIFGRMRENSLCDVYKGIQDYLFSKLLQNDPATTQVLGRWTTLRQRSHFVQPCAASAIAWEKA